MCILDRKNEVILCEIKFKKPAKTILSTFFKSANKEYFLNHQTESAKKFYINKNIIL